MRTCDVCEAKMVEGYLDEESCEYFCSDKCLDVTYPGQSIVQAAMSDEDLEESTLYWTAWEEEIKCPCCEHTSTSAEWHEISGDDFAICPKCKNTCTYDELEGEEG